MFHTLSKLLKNQTVVFPPAPPRKLSHFLRERYDVFPAVSSGEVQSVCKLKTTKENEVENSLIHIF